MNEYYLKNKERFRLYAKKKASERKSDKDAAEYLKNTMPDLYDKVKSGVEENRKPYNESKESRATYIYRSYIGYDKKKGYVCDLTEKWIKKNILDKKCFYCGCDDFTQLGADRIDNTKGHTKNNVVPCCLGCNGRRGKKTFYEWLSVCKNWGYFGRFGEIIRIIKAFFIKKSSS